jgi:hypothetical protein
MISMAIINPMNAPHNLRDTRMLSSCMALPSETPKERMKPAIITFAAQNATFCNRRSVPGATQPAGATPPPAQGQPRKMDR